MQMKQVGPRPNKSWMAVQNLMTVAPRRRPNA